MVARGCGRGTFTLLFNLSRGRLLRRRVDRMLERWRGRQSGGDGRGLSGGPSSPQRDYASCRCSQAASSMNARCSRLEIPERYRAAHNLPPTPPPALDWWRGFRSRELTEPDRGGADRQFRHRGRDGADRPGRRAEQDRRRAAVAGRRFRRQRDALAAGGRTRPHHLSRRAHRQLRDRFLGQEPRELARRAGERDRRALRPRRDRGEHGRERGDRLFPGAGVAGPAADREPERRGRQPRADADPAAAGGRHRLGARSRAAGNAGGEPARANSCARRGLAAEHRDARAADRAARRRSCGCAAAASIRSGFRA